MKVKAIDKKKGVGYPTPHALAFIASVIPGKLSSLDRAYPISFFFV